jgi:hypothetical protein
MLSRAEMSIRFWTKHAIDITSPHKALNSPTWINIDHELSTKIELLHYAIPFASKCMAQYFAWRCHELHKIIELMITKLTSIIYLKDFNLYSSLIFHKSFLKMEFLKDLIFILEEIYYYLLRVIINKS